MLILLFYFFVGWSITSLIVNGSIFNGIRTYLLVRFPFFGKLVSCVQCTSVWVGFFMYSALFLLDQMPWISTYGIINILGYTFFQSGFCVLTESLVIYLIKPVSNVGSNEHLRPNK